MNRRAVLLVAILLIPTASAAELQLHVPETSSAGEPILGGYTIGGPGAYEGHVDITMEFWLDGYLVLETPSLHEHDGVHTFAFTPPAPGNLQALAYRDGAVVGNASITITEAGTETPPMGGITVDHARWWEASVAEDVRTWVDLVRSDGALLASGWPVPDSEFMASHPDGVEDRIWFLAGNESQRGGYANVGQSHINTGRQQPTLTGSYGDLDACGASLVFDPVGQTGDMPSFQAGSQIRLSSPGTQSRTGYVIRTTPIEPEAAMDHAPRLYMETVAPLRPFTFTPSQSGVHEILVNTGADGTLLCKEQYLVTPGPTAMEGSVQYDLIERTAGIDITLTPLGSDGAKLGHYEFDTRVYRLGNSLDAGLVWSGKLHGHAGPVSLHLHNLHAGEYLVRTFPSPQSADTPTVGGEATFGFTIAAENGTAALPDGTLAPWLPTAAKPAPSSGQEAPGLTLVVLMVAVALLARRRQI